jgi:hypothetical protein
MNAVTEAALLRSGVKEPPKSRASILGSCFNVSLWFCESSRTAEECTHSQSAS